MLLLHRPDHTRRVLCSGLTVPDGGRHCWCFGSNGLQALGQKELVFLLECLPDEKSLPRDLFSLYLNIYQEAQKGETQE